jgi:hypothetical protein
MIDAIVTLIFNMVLAIVKFIGRLAKKLLFATGLIVPVAVALIFALLFGLNVIEYSPISLAFVGVLCGGSFLYVIYRSIKKRLGKLPQRSAKILAEVQPRVFRVKQNPKYIMYEYPDKVELYEETKRGRKYIRTDKRRF